MICPNCSNDLSDNFFCDTCKKEVKIYKKLWNTSNWLYNEGLEKAKRRDLSGAIADLKHSVHFNKRNVDARNLLGVVYFEVGEVVLALEQWVISKNLTPDNNIADKYIANIQANPTKLASLNQAIKKYNQALIYVGQKSLDLAIIQLKNVISLNANFIKAYELLALVYVKEGETEKARRILKKILAIDMNNNFALRLQNEIHREHSSTRVTTEKKESKKSSSEERANVFSKGFDRNTSGVQFLNIFVGFIIGVAFLGVLVLPDTLVGSKERLSQQQKEYEKVIAEKNTKISQLDSADQQQLEQINLLEEEIVKFGQIENELTSAKNLLTAAEAYINNKKQEAADILIQIDPSLMTEEAHIQMYNTIKNATFADAARSYFNSGYTDYRNTNFNDSIPKFVKALEFVSTDTLGADSMYFLARSYERNDDKANAKIFYQRVIDEFPNTKRATDSRSYLNRLN